MLKRLVLVIGVVAALMFMASPADAEGYPPSPKAPHVDQPVSVAPTQAPVAGQPTGALPTTGDDSTVPLARVGVVLVAAGGVVLLATRRRQASFHLT